jgi:hypothetical protein
MGDACRIFGSLLDRIWQSWPRVVSVLVSSQENLFLSSPNVLYGIRKCLSWVR